MKRITTYMLCALVALSACSKEEMPTKPHNDIIEVEVAEMPSTRVNMINTVDDIVARGEFGLSAYLDGINQPYFENAFVYYFAPDTGAAHWRFRDVQNQDNLINFFWPDGAVDFMGYLPRVLTKCVAGITNLKFNPATNAVTFNAVAQTEIDDRPASKRSAEGSTATTTERDQEFLFATTFGATRDGNAVNLRFVHPFSAIKFRLHQSHRDLTIHSITINGLKTEGSFSCTNDTYAKGNTQSYLEYTNWSTSTSETSSLKIDIEKSVPQDINYSSTIGGPYIVIPQSLDGVTLSVNYTWNEKRVQSKNIPIKTDTKTAWQPGQIYTYTLDLGDNKEEILFKVGVEAWDKGEDDDYENNYDVE
jgi:hypothetical protein